jgi:hypothetical protein
MSEPGGGTSRLGFVPAPGLGWLARCCQARHSAARWPSAMARHAAIGMLEPGGGTLYSVAEMPVLPEEGGLSIVPEVSVLPEPDDPDPELDGGFSSLRSMSEPELDGGLSIFPEVSVLPEPEPELGGGGSPRDMPDLPEPELAGGFSSLRPMLEPEDGFSSLRPMPDFAPEGGSLRSTIASMESHDDDAVKSS